MIDDFTMITHQFPDTIKIIPVADVHLGAIEHDQKAWESFLQSVLAEPNIYICLLGDLLNNSIRGAGFANPFDEVIRPMAAKKMMVEYLTPIRDRILCCCDGNHEYRTTRETDQSLSFDIMAKLDLEDLYRENQVFMKISIGRRGKGKAEQPGTSYMFVMTHGTGGGVLPGSTANRNERSAYIYEGIDCLVAAHTHRGMLTRPDKIVLDPRNNRVTLRSCLVASAESWLTYGGYAARKMLLPNEHGKPFVMTLADTRGEAKRIEVTW
jgi:hypothetical protein